MSVFGFLENFFFITLGLAFALVLLLVYHFKNRMSVAEKKSDTMYGLLSSVVKEIKSLRNMFGMGSSVQSEQYSGGMQSNSGELCSQEFGAGLEKQEVITINLASHSPPLNTIVDKIVVSDGDSDRDESESEFEYSDSESEEDDDDSTKDLSEKDLSEKDLTVELIEVYDLSEKDLTVELIEVEKYSGCFAGGIKDLTEHDVSAEQDLTEHELTAEQDLTEHELTEDIEKCSGELYTKEFVEHEASELSEKDLSEKDLRSIPEEYNLNPENFVRSILPEKDKPTIENLKKMNINQLKTLAIQSGLKTDTSKLKKHEIITLILDI